MCNEVVSNADPDVYTVDIFPLNWNGFQFYAFPSFSCVSQCLHKIRTDKAEWILVVLHWLTQLLYSKMTKMKKGVPITIPPSLTNLAQSNNEKMKQTAAEKTGLMYQGSILKSIDTIIPSWRKTTSAKYKICINQWLGFCKNCGIDPKIDSVKDGLDFLTSLLYMNPSNDTHLMVAQYQFYASLYKLMMV